MINLTCHLIIEFQSFKKITGTYPCLLTCKVLEIRSGFCYNNVKLKRESKLRVRSSPFIYPFQGWPSGLFYTVEVNGC